MVTELDILQSVKNKLNIVYPEYPVFLDEVKEGFSAPCFFSKNNVVKASGK